MKKGPRIIIICFAYNCQAYIEQTIASVLNQTYNNYLFLIVENGSNDRTRDILSKYKSNSQIIYQETDYNNHIFPDKHTVKPWGDIVELFDDDYITRIDSDDYFEPDALQIMADAIEEHNADLVFTGCNMFNDGNEKKKAVRKPSKDRYYKNIGDLAEDWIDIYGSIRTSWSNAYKYEIYKELSKMLNKYKIINGADTLTNILLLGLAADATAISKVTVNYRIRMDSSYHKDINPERYKAYDIIHDESHKLLKKWNCNDIKVYYFLELVRESAMSDLIANASLSKVNYANNIKLINNIFTDESFYCGMKKFSIHKEFLENTMSVLSSSNLLKENSIKDFGNCFVLLLTQAIKKENNNIRLYLAGLYHKNNDLNWGGSYINIIISQTAPWISKIFPEINWEEIALKSKLIIRDLLQGKYLEVAKQVEKINIEELELFINKEWESKQERIECLYKEAINLINNNQDAAKEINNILFISPIDEKTIKLLMLNNLNFGYLSDLIETALMIRAVYSDNVELLYMAALGFEHVNMRLECIECLECASCVAEDVEQIKLLLDEINRVKQGEVI